MPGSGQFSDDYKERHPFQFDRPDSDHPINLKELSERFEFLGPIGSGGMGAIFRARHRLLGGIVAVKVLQPQHSSDAAITRFQREAQALFKLDHINIIKVLEFGVTGEQPYMVMDFADGQSLAQYLAGRGRHSFQEAIPIILQICEGIEYVHSCDILHRDLKPTNVMLKFSGRDGRPMIKIIDFGIAKLFDEAKAEITRAGEIFGSPLYMSPEQGHGSEPTVRSDIYSFGCVMYEILSGSPPFSGNSALHTLMMKASEEAPPLSSVVPGESIPPGLERVLAKCLAIDPSQRYKTMAAVRHDLEVVQNGAGFKISHSSYLNPKNPVFVVSFVLANVIVFSLSAIFFIKCFKNNAISQMAFNSTRSASSASSSSPSAASSAPPTASAPPPNSNSASGAVPALKAAAPGSFAESYINPCVKKTEDGYELLWTKQINVTPELLSELKAYMADSGSLPLIGLRLNPGTEVTNDMCAEIGGMLKLKKLVIASGAMTAEGVAKLEPLQNLQELILIACTSVDDRCCSSFAKMKSLRRLSMSKCQVTNAGMKPLSGLEQLEYLSVWGDEGVDDSCLSTLAQMKKLDFLVIRYGCKITPEGLGDYSNKLHLKGIDAESRAMGPGGLQFLSNYKLQTLHLWGNNLDSGSLQSLVGMPLEELRIGRNPLVKDFSTLSEIHTLKTLFVNEGKLEDDNLASLSNLEGLTELNLNENFRLTDRAFDHISKLKNLEVLHIQSNRHFTKNAIAKLCSLPRLRKLYIDGTVFAHHVDQIVKLKPQMEFDSEPH